MSFTSNDNGRLCNQIFRNFAVSKIAEKHDLHVDYSNIDLINQLGINFYIGNNTYNETIILNDNNYFDILFGPKIYCNINANKSYFQTKEISNMIYNHLQNDIIKQHIINSNQFKDRYNNNNDLFIHIRLTDVKHLNPGINYYLNTISKINKLTDINNIYISSDDIYNELIKTIIIKNPTIILLNHDEIKTIQFGSTCKNIILSHGSFSAIIGYLAFNSQVYYPAYEENKIWYGDIFSINGWNNISLSN